MGTNYYWHPEDGGKLHIGKSSAGWCFSLHVIPELGINDLNDWCEVWKGNGKIRNEDEGYISHCRMYEVIASRSWPAPYTSKYFCYQNNCIPGPNGLVRHKLGDGCIGHGAGTWDLIVGEFS